MRVRGSLSDDGLRLLRGGLALDGRPLKPAQVEWINRDQLRFVLKKGASGRFAGCAILVGLKVVGLKRVRVGNIKLGDLPEGSGGFEGRWR